MHITAWARVAGKIQGRPSLDGLTKVRELLDWVCHDHIVNVQHAIPANVGYGGGHGRIPFPFTVCTSVNNVICHGMPSEGKVLKDGDTSRMYKVDTPSVMTKRLVETTRDAMFRGIRTVNPGATLGETPRRGLWQQMCICRCRPAWAVLRAGPDKAADL